MPEYMAAAKTVKESAPASATDELVREAALMAQMDRHPNIVSLVGVVTRGTPKMLLISLAQHGSLLEYLQKNSGANNLNLTPTLRASAGLHVARGMAHISAFRLVHRDLAARNVLVGSGWVFKVADFGLSRAATSGGNGNSDAEEYYRSRNGVFPVRWTAPEAMKDSKYTQASDVWSFGITLVEVYTDGAQPYACLLYTSPSPRDA